MAEPYDTLLQVQELDIELDQLRHRIEVLPERAALVDVRARRHQVDTVMVEVQVRIDALAGRQEALDVQIAASARRRHDIEERMRSGGVTASRDLQAMDQEVNQLADRQRALEDEEIDLLEEEEPLDVALADHRSEAVALAAEEARLIGAVADAEVELHAAIAAVDSARASGAEGLPVDLAERYEWLRSHLGGIGAARLAVDRCDGCHLTLPSVELERIRRQPAEALVTCPQCDRILVR